MDRPGQPDPTGTDSSTDPGEFETIDISVPEPLEGERVDRVVSMVADVSRRDAAALIADGSVTIDGVVPTKPSERLSTGAALVVVKPVPRDVLTPAPDIDVPLVHVDEYLLVVDKPASLVVHPGAGVHDGTMIQALLARFPDLAQAGGDPDRPGIVHRLDRGTSGLLVVARRDDIRQALSQQLSRRTVSRTYLALVSGTLASSEGLIDAPLGRSAREPTKRAVIVGGRSARTRYRVLGRVADPEVTLLECRLETGRTHQIRAHLEAIDHPVIGDRRYGTGQPTLGLHRPFLHAAQLGFDHPATGRACSFRSPVPDDLRGVLEQLGLPTDPLAD